MSDTAAGKSVAAAAGGLGERAKGLAGWAGAKIGFGRLVGGKSEGMYEPLAVARDDASLASGSMSGGKGKEETPSEVYARLSIEVSPGHLTSLLESDVLALFFGLADLDS